MRFPYLAPGRGLPTQTERTQTLDLIRVRGVPSPTSAPRELTAQPAPRGQLVSWASPGGDPTRITGWRVYRGTDAVPYQTIPDRGTRQAFVEGTAGQNQAVYVSSLNALGVESPKVQVISAPVTEVGAPTMPSLPIGFTNGPGLNTNSSAGRNRLDQT